MHTWTRRMVVAALLGTGCTGSIETPGAGSGPGGPGNGSGANSGAGGAGSGASSGTGASGTTDPTVCIPGVPQTSQLPRLSRAQYDNTIRDLFGIEGQPSSMLAPDSPGSVDKRAWDGYKAAAAAIATQAMQNPAARARAIPCSPAGDGAACARQLIEQFGRRAFRRPLAAPEIARFEALFASRAQITPTGSFDEAAQLILEAFLLSPSFLTRAEIAEVPDGEYFVLNGYEVASRLSYMLWGSMPDDALFDAAAAGGLASVEGILTQAQRMLADPKARARVGAFHELYAHMGDGTRWTDITRDPSVFPAFTPAMGPLLSEETRRFFDHVVFDRQGTFQDLITSPVGFVNRDLAPLYGLDAAQYGADLVAVDLDPTQRAGVLTRLGFLASHSLYNRTSPILRGAFIQKEVLCTPIAPPPPDVESTPLPAVGATNRERVTAQTAAAECAGCHHAVINPTGFALEAYDGIGRWQTAEGGAPIDSSATVLVGGAGVAVAGPVDLMAKVAASPQAQRCYAQKWVAFAYERAANNADSCTVENLASKLTQGGYSVLDLIADLTQTQSFRYRAVETELLP